MSLAQRIRSVLAGLVMMVGAFVLVSYPEEGFALVVAVLCLMLLGAGIRWVVYYFTMGRHMVDGKWSLYVGAFLFDLGFLTGSLTDVPKSYVMLYLVAGHLFTGLVSVLGALEAKRYESPWKLKMTHGVVNIVVSVVCLVLIRSLRAVVYLYSAGLVYSACMRIATALRRTSIVYIS